MVVRRMEKRLKRRTSKRMKTRALTNRESTGIVIVEKAMLQLLGFCCKKQSVE